VVSDTHTKILNIISKLSDWYRVKKKLLPKNLHYFIERIFSSVYSSSISSLSGQIVARRNTEHQKMWGKPDYFSTNSHFPDAVHALRPGEDKLVTRGPRVAPKQT